MKFKFKFKKGEKNISFQIDGEFVIAIMVVVVVLMTL